ncbi:hypothetical protein [Brunnivagina elsteri]|uniref:hypothetical protein n=1 Tax=Brunnivagina elsteri TaxID=1247191 RepID=UPI001FEC1BFE|nr:hypothetical protein [Calothrix elsteri]
MSVPAWETDLWTQQASTTQRVGKFLPEKLLHLSKWVAGRSQFITEEISCVPEDKGVEHRKKNETKASTTNHSTSQRRKAKSSNKTNSTVSGQDTRKQKSRRVDSKE